MARKKFNFPQKIKRRFLLLWDCGKLPKKIYARGKETQVKKQPKC